MERLQSALLLTLCTLAGCAIAVATPDENRDKASGGATLRVTTFNAGLAHGFVDYAVERRAPIIDALRESEADVVCLEEVWTDEDSAAIRYGLARDFPYSLDRPTSEPDASEFSPCDARPTLALGWCIESSCGEQSNSECVSEGGACEEAYDGVSGSCKTCLAANVHLGSVGSAFACVAGAPSMVSWGGRNGLLLLSRKPIEGRSYRPFESQLVKRGVLEADIEGVRVQCTHLAANLTVPPYPEGGSFNSWADERDGQIGSLAEGAGEGCTILAGDLNTGAAGPDYDAEFAQSMELLEGYGYREYWPSSSCTYCAENPLVDGDTSVRLDHVMLRGCPGAEAEYEVVLDQVVPLSLEPGTSYEDTRLSDHYGVEALITGL